jgi:hypothetical protein
MLYRSFTDLGGWGGVGEHREAQTINGELLSNYCRADGCGVRAGGQLRVAAAGGGRAGDGRWSLVSNYYEVEAI